VIRFSELAGFFEKNHAFELLLGKFHRIHNETGQVFRRPSRARMEMGLFYLHPKVVYIYLILRSFVILLYIRRYVSIVFNK
jgi:hypothetical protein